MQKALPLLPLLALVAGSLLAAEQVAKEAKDLHCRQQGPKLVCRADPGSSCLELRWWPGDGTPSTTGKSFEHEYLEPGQVTLSVECIAKEIQRRFHIPGATPATEEAPAEPARDPDCKAGTCWLLRQGADGRLSLEPWGRSDP